MSDSSTQRPLMKPVPRAPEAEDWHAMTPEAKEAFLNEANAALERQIRASPEGVPHHKARIEAKAVLGEYFQRIGRQVYLASDLAVHYPTERVFAPDLLAVLDVEDPGDADERMAWVVADEGKGLDLVLEVLHHGDRKKDLFDNLAFYAHLGISEYFVYDRSKQRLLGHRLPAAIARRYEPIPAILGNLPSRVLGLNLGVVGGKLRFFHGDARLPTSGELLDRINGMLEEAEARAEAEQARAEAEQARAEAEQARAETEQARTIALARRALQALLRVRGLSPSEVHRDQIEAEEDLDRLERWLARAEEISTVEELLRLP